MEILLLLPSRGRAQVVKDDGVKCGVVVVVMEILKLPEQCYNDLVHAESLAIPIPLYGGCQ